MANAKELALLYDALTVCYRPELWHTIKANSLLDAITVCHTKCLMVWVYLAGMQVCQICPLRRLYKPNDFAGLGAAMPGTEPAS